MQGQYVVLLLLEILLYLRGVRGVRGVLAPWGALHGLLDVLQACLGHSPLGQGRLCEAAFPFSPLGCVLPL
jgi:hypothetical protein